jgi:hypothetical protein
VVRNSCAGGGLGGQPSRASCEFRRTVPRDVILAGLDHIAEIAATETALLLLDGFLM